jgi:predicted nucleic acid-binding protein
MQNSRARIRVNAPLSPRRQLANSPSATAFWDASALLPLCIHEAASRHAQSHLRRFAPAVWWGSLVEVHSAICRLHRNAEITDLDKHGAVARLGLLNRGWREILPGDQVCDLARQLLDRHPLRAADSLQLAAALVWCEQRPSGRSFIWGDSDWPKPQRQLDSQFSNFQELLPEQSGDIPRHPGFHPRIWCSSSRVRLPVAVFPVGACTPTVK